MSVLTACTKGVPTFEDLASYFAAPVPDSQNYQVSDLSGALTVAGSCHEATVSFRYQVQGEVSPTDILTNEASCVAGRFEYVINPAGAFFGFNAGVPEAKTLSLFAVSPALYAAQKDVTVSYLPSTNPSIFIGGASANEGETLQFTVSLSMVTGVDVTFTYETIGGTAGTSDYGAVTLAGTIPALSLSSVIRVSSLEDSLDEYDETFEVSLSGASGGVFAVSSNSGLILDDDNGPRVFVADAAPVSESETALFVVTLSGVSGKPVEFDYATVDGTAIAGQDYSGIATTRVTLATGALSYAIRVVTTEDLTDEDPSQNFSVSLAGLVGLQAGDLSAVGTILDTDAEPVIFVADASVSEGGTLGFVVSLSRASDRPVSFRVSTQNGASANGAVAGSDYTAVSFAAFTITAGSGAMTIGVATAPDGTDEADEILHLNIDQLFNATAGDLSSDGTIIDDDDGPGVFVTDAASVEEGLPARFVITLSAVSGQAVSFDYATVDGSAVFTQDYVQVGPTSVTIAAGQAGITVSIPTTNDPRDEDPAETFTIIISNGVNGILADSLGVGTIVDNDNPPRIYINDAADTEGGVLGFVVSLSQQSDLPVEFTYALLDGTEADKALGGLDYTDTPGAGTIAPAAWTTTVQVTTLQDITYEGTEKFTVSLATHTNSVAGDLTGLGQITPDADVPPVILINDLPVNEGETGLFSANLTALSGLEVVLTWRTYDGGASSADYTEVSPTTVTIAAGSPNVILRVVTTEDLVDEGDETFLVSVVSATGASFPAGPAVGTITDDDGAPLIYIDDAAAVNEGQTATFTVSISAVSGVDVTFDYQTWNDTAVSTQDYAAAGPASAMIPAGQTSVTIKVVTVDDTRDELAAEYFKVSLSALGNADAGDLIADGTVNDDDDPPALYIFDHAGEPEGSLLNVVVSLAAASDLAVGFKYTTYEFEGADAATAGDDFAPLNDVSGEIPAGGLVYYIPVTNIDDEIYESTEKLLISLSGVTNAVEGDYLGEIDLPDGDLPPVLEMIAGPAVDEGDDAHFMVSLSRYSSREVTFNYYTADGTAVSGTDYTGISLVQGTIGPMMLAVTYTVGTLDNAFDETDTRTFSAQADGLTNVTGSDMAMLTINDDDLPPVLSVLDASGEEGSDIQFVVTMSSASKRSVSFGYQTYDGSASVSAADYSFASGGGIIPAGQTSITIPVMTTEDLIFELTETFTVSLDSFVDASGGDAIGAMTINDDDSKPLLYVDDALASEGSTLQFTVSLGAVSGIDTILTFSTSDGTATLADSDYTQVVAKPLTIAAGVTTAIAKVVTTGDAKFEDDESIAITLLGSAQADPGDMSATGTIGNDDSMPELRIYDVAVSEGDTATFVASLSAVSGAEVIFSWETNNGATASLADYTSVSSVTITISAGQLLASLEVQTTEDSLDEETETFSVIATIDSGASLYFPLPTGSINDDDAAPTLNIIAGDAVDEGGTGLFIVSLTAESGLEVSFDYYTQDSSAQAPGDYTAISLTRGTINPGQITFAIEVPVQDDEVYEPSVEAFNALITNPSATASIGANLAVVSVNDTDSMPSLFISDAAFAEGDSLAFVVTLSHLSAVNSTFMFQTLPGTGPYVAGAEDYGGITMAGQVDSGQLSATIYVENKEDILFEDDENFLVTLVGLGDALAGKTGAVGTIGDDDVAPSLSINPIVVTEGQSASFVVNISALSGKDTIFTWQTYDLTTAGDFTPVAPTQATISAGSPSVQLDVETINDDTTEPVEYFRVSLSSPINATVATDFADATLNDNDGPPSIFIADAPAVDEGHTALFVVSLSNISATDVTFNYETLDDTAVAPGDFNAVTAQPAVINAGDLAVTIPIVTNLDTKDEVGTEYFKVSLSGVAGANHGTIIADGAINDLNSEPLLYISDATADEGADLEFVVSIDSESEREVTFNYQTHDGTDPDKAEAAQSDYSAASSSGAIPAGTMSITLSISALNDDIYEPEEKMTVSLSALSFATVGDDLGEGRITDMDVQPTLAMYLVSSPTLNEGETATFMVSLSHLSAMPVTFDVNTITISAREFDDFTPKTAEPTAIPALTYGTTFDVFTTEDEIHENSEEFAVSLSNSSGAIGEPYESIWIIDTDERSYIYVTDTSVTEDGTAYFVVSLNKPSGFDVSFNLDTVDGTAETADADYTAVSGTFTILEGGLSISVGVDTIQDPKFELDETFTVEVSSALGTYAGKTDGTGIINNDDAPPVMSVYPSEGSEGSMLSFKVSLSAPSAVDASADWTVEHGSTSLADFNAPISGSVVIPADTPVSYVDISTFDDALHETDETFLLTLDAATNTTLGAASATGKIIDSDPAPGLVLMTFPATEGSEATHTVSLTAMSGVDAVFDWKTGLVDGGATGGDFTEVSWTRRTITAGSLVMPVVVQTQTDSIDEDDEAYLISVAPISHLAGAAVGASPLIFDDTPDVTISLLDPALVMEGSEAVITVTLSGLSQRPIHFYYRTYTATAGPMDFTEEPAGEASIPAMQWSSSITISTSPDEIYEGSQDFLVSIASAGPVNATGNDFLATVTIGDDDPMPKLYVDDASATEGGILQFTVSIDRETEAANSFMFQTTQDVAKPVTDYNEVSTEYSFTPGVISIDVSVGTIDDGIGEYSETFDVALTAVSGLDLGDTTAIGTIDDDDPPAIFVTQASASEGSEILFAVTLTVPSASEITFNYTTMDGTATSAQSDYTTKSGPATIVPGNLGVTIAVQTGSDGLYEYDETLILTISAISGAQSGTLFAEGTVFNLSAKPLAVVYDAQAVEGSSLIFVISLDVVSAVPAVFNYATDNGSITAVGGAIAIGADYGADSGQITILPGSMTIPLMVSTAVDADYEPLENMLLTISAGAPHAEVLDPAGLGFIHNDDCPASGWCQQSYLKPANAQANENFGDALAMDLNTIVVGAWGEPASVSGVTNGTGVSTNTGASNSGAVFVYSREGSNWTQQAYLKAADPANDDKFGSSVAVDRDTILVGAQSEDSSISGVSNGATGFAGTGAGNSGAAYVFKRTGATWVQEAALKAADPMVNDWFGTSVALSGDLAVVGAPGEDSDLTGVINGTGGAAGTGAQTSGAVYAFRRTGTTWIQEAVLKAADPMAYDNFGSAAAATHDTIVVGAYQEDSSSTGVTNGAFGSALGGLSNTGAVYVFRRTGVTWGQEAYLKAAAVASLDHFGISVAVDSDTVIVGTTGDDSNSTGVYNGTGKSSNASASNSGAAYVFKRTGVTWIQQAYLKAGDTSAGDEFGSSVDIKGDLLAVGAEGEASRTSIVINGQGGAADTVGLNTGAAYLFRRTGMTWIQEAYLKAPNAKPGSRFGASVSLDGDSMVVGASLEDGFERSVGNQPWAPVSPSTAANVGAAYAFARKGQPYVTIKQAAHQPDPTSSLPIEFEVEFSQPINPATFSTSDITQSGAATGITWSIINQGDDRRFTLQATTGSIGTYRPEIAAAAVQTPDGDWNLASSSSQDDTVTLNSAATPGVVSVSASNANGAYGAGSQIYVRVTFSSTVFVDSNGGTPSITLATGAMERSAIYSSGSGTPTLEFSYTVQAGDSSSDLDYVSALSLALNGGTIRDSSDNDAGLTLPAPGSLGSLSANRNIMIDTDAPTAVTSLNDATWSNSLTTSPTILWDASTDSGSGVSHYELAIGTSAGGTEVLGWTDVGDVVSVQWPGLALTNAITYYASVRAVDYAGNASTVAQGDGWTTDNQAPTVPATIDDGVLSGSLMNTPTVTWSASSDGGGSGISNYQIAIGTSAGGTDIHPWTNIGNTTTKIVTGLSLFDLTTYYASVRAVDVAGNVSDVGQGDGWQVNISQVLGNGIIRVATATANNGSGDTMLTIPRPEIPGISGKFLLAVVTVRGTSTSISPPGGWSTVTSMGTVTNLKQAVFYRIAGASEPSNYSFNFSMSQKASGAILVYSGVDATTPILVTNGAQGNGNSITAPSVNITDPNSRVVTMYGIANDGSIVVPQGYQGLIATDASTGNATTSRTRTTISTEFIPNTGFTGTKIATAIVGGENIGQIVVLKRAYAQPADPCAGRAIGQTCIGGGIFAGLFRGDRIMIMPGGCDGSLNNPSCPNGNDDSLVRFWFGTSGSGTDISTVENVDVATMASSQMGDTGTEFIVASGLTDTDSPAHYCSNMGFGNYVDWSLPSKSEMAYVYCKSNVSGGSHNPLKPDEDPNCAGFGGKTSDISWNLGTTVYYWTSSESVTAGSAYFQNFSTGAQAALSKNNDLAVRCIRRY